MRLYINVINFITAQRSYSIFKCSTLTTIYARTRTIDNANNNKVECLRTDKNKRFGGEKKTAKVENWIDISKKKNHVNFAQIIYITRSGHREKR